MKSIIAIVFVVLFVFTLSGCTTTEEDNLEVDDNIWSEINDVEFHNQDVWAGQGIYFFTEDGDRFCRYMDFGSGIPILYSVDYKITSIEGDSITMLVPIYEEGVEYSIGDTVEFEELSITFENDEIVWGDFIYFRSEISFANGWPE